MDSSENGASRISRLKPPSQIAAPTKCLSEMTASDSNARGGIPQPSTALKHKATGLPEPAPKRVTLAEKAGQPSRPHSVAPPNSRLGNGSARPASGLNKSSSVSGRPQSAYGRHAQSNSFSASVGPGVRPPAARPQTSMAHGRAASHNTVPRGRPASVMDNRSTGAQQTGTVPISVSTYCPGITVRKPRGQPNKDHGYISSGRRSCSASTSNSYEHPLSVSREDSLSVTFSRLTLNGQLAEADESTSDVAESKLPPPVPSQLPRPLTRTPKTPARQPVSATPSKTKQHKSPSKEPFLTRDSNTKAPAPAWDVDDRFNAMEQMYKELQQRIEGGILDQKSAQSTAELHQARIGQLEMQTTQMNTQNQRLQFEVDDWKSKHSSLTATLDDERRSHKNEIDDLRREHRNHIDDMRDLHRKDIERAQRETMHEAEGFKRSAQDQMDRLVKEQREELIETEQRLTRELDEERSRLNRELDEERSRRAREVQELTTQWTLHRQTAEADNDKKDREAQSVRAELNQVIAELEREKATTASLKEKLAQSTTDTMTVESTNRAMKAKIDFLESDNQAQSQSFADLHKRMQEAVEAMETAQEKLRTEETLRRKLHNQVQELKGNIRVFCRVRPTLDAETEQAAQIAYPDAGEECKEVTVQGPETKSALGNVTTSNNAFSFDRVFGPQSQNGEVFDEISQLVQSALDGYNVCIFCYGQTGSGKTYTMSTVDGMIPRAVQQIYTTATSLEEKGWTYSMEGSFVEVYNENLNDLLGRADEFDKKKHEIRHDTAKCQTTITGVTTVVLDTPEKVDGLLKKAHTNRSVAATQSNERSSRSHSVFILKLIGENSITGERSEGTLNLVDLAGSERVDKSGVQGARLKETQNINRSLSCLGDVIGALGTAKEGSHIPYRNSKLTYLLQYSLGGNSKTLMFVMVSPLHEHLGETITSLRFATKVHNTHIGTAKRQARVKD